MSSNKMSQAEIEELVSRPQQTLPPEAAASGSAAAAAVPAHTIEKITFPELTPQPPGGKQRDLAFFGAVPVKLSLELGKATLTVKEILQLQEGSIIKLDTAAGENALLCVNDRPLAAAEVIVINEDIGCRVADFNVHPRLRQEED